MKAVLEIPVPESCRECKIAFMHEVEESKKSYCYGCGYTNKDATGYTDKRAPDCPLKFVL